MPSTALTQLLLDLSHELSHRTSIQETLDEICQQVEKYFSPRHLAVLLVEPGNGDLTFIRVLGEKKELVGGRKLRKGKGLAGWVAETATPLLMESIATDPNFPQIFTAKLEGCATLMAVPLKSGGLVYGVLELIDTQSGQPFTPENLQELMLMGNFFVMALDRAYYCQAMKRMTENDQLTGLPNLRIYRRYIEREVEVCKRYGAPSSVILLTVENLTQINEEHGRAVADKILSMISSILLEELRKADTPCRVGGRRFAVIMPNTAYAPAVDVGVRLHMKIAERVTVRELPSLELAVDVRSGTRDDVFPLMSIVDTRKVSELDPAKFQNVAANLFSLFRDERQGAERRRTYRKDVQMAGQFEDLESGNVGDFLIENLSLTGLGFATLLAHSLAPDMRIKICFCLEGTEKWIVREGVVKYVNDRYVGCQFVDAQNYDSDLGMYLMS